MAQELEKEPSSAAAPNPKQQEIIGTLQKCHDECRRMFMEHVNTEAGAKLSALHIVRLQACIEICGATANYLLKDGLLAHRLCEIAARVCDECAESCEKQEAKHFKRCASLCKEAAQACRKESARSRSAS